MRNSVTGWNLLADAEARLARLRLYFALGILAAYPPFVNHDARQSLVPGTRGQRWSTLHPYAKSGAFTEANHNDGAPSIRRCLPNSVRSMQMSNPTETRSCSTPLLPQIITRRARAFIHCVPQGSTGFGVQTASLLPHRRETLGLRSVAGPYLPRAFIPTKVLLMTKRLRAPSKTHYRIRTKSSQKCARVKNNQRPHCLSSHRTQATFLRYGDWRITTTCTPAFGKR